MEHVTSVILYLIFFRLALIAAGVVSIVLGYRLFVLGVYPPMRARGSTGVSEEVSAEIAGASFNLKNAAPGTSFALFGVIIIVFTFITGQPEATMEMLGDEVEKITLRGEGLEDKQAKPEEGDWRVKSKQALSLLQSDPQYAAEITQNALREASAAMNDFAWVLFKTDADLYRAELLAELAVASKADIHNFYDTLAEVQYKQGKREKAIINLERAYKLNPLPEYGQRLKQWREAP